MMSANRPNARRTVQVLKAGTIVSVLVFALSFGLRLAAQDSVSDTIAVVAVLVLLLTPVGALVTTSIELRQLQRSAAVMAVVVLLILAAATAVALLVAR